MTKIKGIVAGVGNKETNENVITPQFDASVVDFMVGGSAIVEGLQLINKGNNVMTISGTTGSTPNVGNGDIVYYTTGYKSAYIGKNASDIKLEQTVSGISNDIIYDENSGFVKCLIAGIYPNSQVEAELSWTSPIETPILKKGIVVHKGYRGELTSDIELGSETLVYAQFVLRNNEEVTDEFNVVTTSSPLSAETIDGDTITYNLWLYNSNGRKNPALYNIPAIAEHSLTCDTVLEGGMIDSNVTGITQAVNDNSSRIATTEYVENQIAHDIDSGTVTLDLHWEIDDVENHPSFEGKVFSLATLVLQRKAKQVLAQFTMQNGITETPFSYFSATAIEKLPTGFRPTKNHYCYVGYQHNEDAFRGDSVIRVAIHKDGSINFVENDLASWTVPDEFTTVVCGWETL